MKTASKLLILLSFIFICVFAYGQTAMEDIIYLKNGSIIRGVIIEQIPNQSIKVQTKDKNVFVFKYEEIEKMTKEESKIENNNTGNDFNNSDIKTSGYVNYSEVFYNTAIGNAKSPSYSVKNGDYSYGFKTVNGFYVKDNISLGLGIGIEKFQNVSDLPLTLESRLSLIKGKVSPVFNVAVGYGIGLDGSSGGLLFNPSFGIKAYISKNVAYLFNIGYRLKTIVWDLNIYNNGYYVRTIQETALWSFVSISTGLAF